MMEGVMKQTTDIRSFQSRKFGLYLAMASMVMMFAAFTSAYVVRKAAGNWLEFSLPGIFYISSVVILVSSFTAEMCRRAFNRAHLMQYRMWVVVTLALGVLFVVMQYFGWTRLFEIGIPLDGNPSGSFVYVISGFHALHVLGGMIGWILQARSAWLPGALNELRGHHLSLVNIFWHFVGGLWIYLLLFITLQ